MAQLIVEQILLALLIEVEAGFRSTGINRVTIETVKDPEVPILNPTNPCLRKIITDTCVYEPTWLDTNNENPITIVRRSLREINEEEQMVAQQQYLNHTLYWMLMDDGDIANTKGDSHVRVSTKDASTDREPMEMMKQYVPEEHWEYANVFSKETFDKLPARSEFDHAINLDKNFIPKHARPFLLSPREQKELDNFLKENLETGQINPSKSPQMVPFFAEKPDKSALRPIQDYRPSNAHTIQDCYPLSVLEDLPQHIGKAKYFMVINIR
jgi:hypothetical protein